MDFKSFEVYEKNGRKPSQRKYFGCPSLYLALGAIPRIVLLQDFSVEKGI